MRCDNISVGIVFIDESICRACKSIDVEIRNIDIYVFRESVIFGIRFVRKLIVSAIYIFGKDVALNDIMDIVGKYFSVDFSSLLSDETPSVHSI